MTAEDDASMPDRITPHPDYAEKAAAQWPNLTCWIIEPAKENQ